MPARVTPVLLLFAIASTACDRAVDETFHSSEGEPLLASSNCLACHAASPTVADRIQSMPAPLLNDVGSRMSPASMRTFLESPHAAKNGALMPSMMSRFPDEERAEYIESLVHYLQSQGGPFEAAPSYVLPGTIARGKRLHDTIGCIACHADDNGPWLASKTSVGSLAEFLEDPVAIRPSGRMPGMDLDSTEAHDIATYLLQLQSTPGELDRHVGLIAEIYDIESEIRQGNVSGLEATETVVAANIDLEDIDRDDMFAVRFRGSMEIPETGTWRFLLSSDDGSWLFIDGEQVVSNGGVHPVADREGEIHLDAGSHDITVVYFELGGDEILDMEWGPPGLEDGEFDPIPDEVFSSQLKTYMPPAGSFQVDQERRDLGESLFAKLGCAACHVPGTPARFTPLAELDPTAGCLSTSEQSDVRVPDYQFDDDQRDSLREVVANAASLEFPLPASHAVSHTMTRLQCLSCHARDGVGGPGPSINAMFTGSADLGDEGRIPPDLTGVGNKLNEEWMWAVLDGKTVRHYMNTRMPRFGSAARVLPPLLVEADAISGDEIEPTFSLEAAEVGHQLLGNNGFKCIECHSFDGLASMGEPGVDLAYTIDRIRPGWFRTLLLDPQAINPGTRMPAFWSSEHAIFPDLLDGDSKQQADAIWSYLSLGASMPLPAGVKPNPGAYELVSIDEPVLFGTFMEGVSPRVITVGYPEKTHVAWDAQNGRLALVWRGGFMDARGTWHSRAGALQNPGGRDVLELPPGPAIAVLDSPEAAWPEQAGEMSAVLRDEERRPSFVTRQDNLEIHESYRPYLWAGGSRLIRSLSVHSPEHQGGIHFRAASGNRIEAVDDEGRWSIDDRMTIVIPGVDAFVRQVGNEDELIVPVRLRQAGDGSDGWVGTVDVEVMW